VGGAAALGYETGKAISGIEVDEKGTTVADVTGKKIYDIYGKLTGKGTSSEQLNTPKTGVAGGDKAIIAKNAEEDAEEEKRLARMKELFGDLANA